MAWNEPGGNNNDPWGNKKNDGGGPPDLDEVFRNLQKKLEGLFGGKRATNSGGGASNGNGGGVKFPGKFGTVGLLAIALIAGVLWLLSGIYIIQPAERGVVTQFGRYSKTTQPGPHWHIPWPIQKFERVNVDQTRSIELRQQDILTRDENIVVIDIAVNFILTEGRGVLAEETQVKLQQTLDDYNAGIFVDALNLASAEAPPEVKPAFDDVIKAREDQQRVINESEAYRNGVLPEARGDAVIAVEQAEAYKAEIVNAAQGEAARFESLLTEYTKAPEITKERLYIESMESVLSNSSKVMVGTGDSGNNLMYLPLDKLMNNTPAPAPTSINNPLPTVNQPDKSRFVPGTNNRSRARGDQ